MADHLAWGCHRPLHLQFKRKGMLFFQKLREKATKEKNQTDGSFCNLYERLHSNNRTYHEDIDTCLCEKKIFEFFHCLMSKV